MKDAEGPGALMPLNAWRGRHHHARTWLQQGSDDLARSEARLTGWGEEGMGGRERQTATYGNSSKMFHCEAEPGY